MRRIAGLSIKSKKSIRNDWEHERGTETSLGNALLKPGIWEKTRILFEGVLGGGGLYGCPPEGKWPPPPARKKVMAGSSRFGFRQFKRVKVKNQLDWHRTMPVPQRTSVRRVWHSSIKLALPYWISRAGPQSANLVVSKSYFLLTSDESDGRWKQTTTEPNAAFDF